MTNDREDRFRSLSKNEMFGSRNRFLFLTFTVRMVVIEMVVSRIRFLLTNIV